MLSLVIPEEDVVEQDVLGKTELELIELLDVNLDDLREALHAISKNVAPKCSSVRIRLW